MCYMWLKKREIFGEKLEKVGKLVGNQERVRARNNFLILFSSKIKTSKFFPQTPSIPSRPLNISFPASSFLVIFSSLPSSLFSCQSRSSCIIIIQMGNKPAQKPNKSGIDDHSQLVKEYTPIFEKLKTNPTFFQQLITENTIFAKHLFQLFPESTHNFQAFFEMVLYLRREDAHFHVNKYASKNGAHTSLLDRFFMIVMKIDHEEYQLKVLNIQELDELLMNYFSLFLENPEKGTITKVLKFMRIQEQQLSVKEFSSSFREYFPLVHKFLKDFYLLKFKELHKDAHLLKCFQSKIIKNDAVLLALKLPKMSHNEIVELYNTEKYGLGFHSIEHRLVGYSGPWLLLIHHIEKNQKGEKQYYIFGSYQNGPIRNVMTHQGDVTGFMFSIHPTIKFLTTDKGQGGKHYFYINSIPQEKSKRRKGFGFGGNHDKQNFKLWIDEDLERASVYNGKDETYGYGALASSGTNKLSIKRMQVWGLGNRHDIEEQTQYWKERQEEITRRRKVDKRELVNQNAELFFENTFAHRGEVHGEIQRKKKEEE